MTTQSTDSSATTDEHRNRNAERAQLHSTIWRIANDLRGSVDGWDFKQYVLGMLFYRYLSESQARFIDENYADEVPFAELKDKDCKEEGKQLVSVASSYYPRSCSQMCTRMLARTRT